MDNSEGNGNGDSTKTSHSHTHSHSHSHSKTQSHSHSHSHQKKLPSSLTQSQSQLTQAQPVLHTSRTSRTSQTSQTSQSQSQQSHPPQFQQLKPQPEQSHSQPSCLDLLGGASYAATTTKSIHYGSRTSQRTLRIINDSENDFDEFDEFDEEDEEDEDNGYNRRKYKHHKGRDSGSGKPKKLAKKKRTHDNGENDEDGQRKEEEMMKVESSPLSKSSVWVGCNGTGSSMSGISVEPKKVSPKHTEYHYRPHKHLMPTSVNVSVNNTHVASRNKTSSSSTSGCTHRSEEQYPPPHSSPLFSPIEDLSSDSHRKRRQLKKQQQQQQQQELLNGSGDKSGRHKKGRTAREWLRDAVAKPHLWQAFSVLVLVLTVVPVLLSTLTMLVAGNKKMQDRLLSSYSNITAGYAMILDEHFSNAESLTHVRSQTTSIFSLLSGDIERVARADYETLSRYGMFSEMYIITRDNRYFRVFMIGSQYFIWRTLENSTLCQLRVENPTTDTKFVEEWCTQEGWFLDSPLYRAVDNATDGDARWTGTAHVRPRTFCHSITIFSGGAFSHVFGGCLNEDGAEELLGGSTQNEAVFVVDAAEESVVGACRGITAHRDGAPVDQALPVGEVDDFRVRFVNDIVRKNYGSWGELADVLYKKGNVTKNINVRNDEMEINVLNENKKYNTFNNENSISSIGSIDNIDSSGSSNINDDSSDINNSTPFVLSMNTGNSTIVSFVRVSRNGFTFVMAVVHFYGKASVSSVVVGIIVAVTVICGGLMGIFIYYVVRPLKKLSRDMVATTDLKFVSHNPQSDAPEGGNGNGNGNGKGKGREIQQHRQRQRQRKHNEHSVLREMHEMEKSFELLAVCTEALTKYISPEIALDVMRGNAIKPQKPFLTIMFVSLCNFLPLLSSLPYKSLMIVLKTWFRHFGKVIISQGGTIDKYIDGCIMAIFGAPKPLANNEDAACNTALHFYSAMQEVEREIEPYFPNRLYYSVGIHCGPTFVGHIGYSERKCYTVIGNNANVASRVEKLTAIYGVSPLITGAVERTVKGKYLCVFLDVVYLRGHDTLRTKIYHLLGFSTKRNREIEIKIVKRFDEIHEKIRNGNKDIALEMIERSLNDVNLEKYKRALEVLKKHVLSNTMTKNIYDSNTEDSDRSSSDLLNV